MPNQSVRYLSVLAALLARPGLGETVVRDPIRAATDSGNAKLISMSPSGGGTTA